MGVLDGEEIPPTYYELPHELTLAAKVEDKECYFKARSGEWEEGSPGFVISFSPDTHAPSSDTDIGRFPAIVCWATTFITISPSVFDSPFAVQGRTWDNTANTEMVNLCKRAISSRTLSFSTATFLWTCGLQPQRTLRYRHRQGRSKGEVDVCGGP